MADHDLWVFGYGSLMWAPGFPHLEVRPALLRGYHRAFSMYSTIAWGSPERPGLVLALIRGGSCRGRAFRVAAAEREEVLAYLDKRERVYLRRMVPLDLGTVVISAVTYVADESHPNFAGKLPHDRAARLIRQGVGAKGSSRDYLANTVRHLDGLGVECPPCGRSAIWSRRGTATTSAWPLRSGATTAPTSAACPRK